MDPLTAQVCEIYGNRLTAYSLGMTATAQLHHELTDIQKSSLSALLRFHETVNWQNPENPSNLTTTSLLMGSNFFDKRLDEKEYSAPARYLNKISTGEFSDKYDDPFNIVSSAQNFNEGGWL